MQSRSVIFSEIERMVDSLRKEMRQGEIKERNDLLCWCLTELELSKGKMFDLLLGMLFGGFETTSVALSLAFFFIGRCPRAFQELRVINIFISVCLFKTLSYSGFILPSNFKPLLGTDLYF